MEHIWLVGMMGSGKSTVGVLMARMLDRPFIDTDTEVVESTGRTIPELFSEGEHIFRAAESEAIAAAARGPGAVVATGGGAILSTDNVAVMSESGTLVLLEVDAETIAERIGLTSERPLAQSLHSVARILAERREIYDAVSDHVVPTVGRAPRDVASEVVLCLDM